jgi:peptidoglycan/LPS O-acetylase OafA/YrhL
LNAALNVLPAQSHTTASSDGGRWFFLDAIKAFACLLIVLHHLSAYSPMFDRVLLLAPAQLAVLYNHGRLAVQFFLVVGGYLTAAQLLRAVPAQSPNLPKTFSVPSLLGKRFLRLATPLMAALAFTVLVTALIRPWFPHSSLSAVPSLWSMVVHLLLLQDLFQVQALSAGIWYVSIDFQLFAIALATLWLAVQLKRWQPQWNLRGLVVLLWFLLSALSLLWWNRQDNMDIEGLYFFGSYGLGMLAYRVRLSRITAKGWCLIFVLGLVAILLEPRLRMGLAWVLALLLAAWPQRTPAQTHSLAWPYLRQGLTHVARQSYAIFLAHFGVSLLVSALWFHAGWQAPWLNVLGMGVSLVLSLGAGNVLYRQVENKPPTLSRLLAWQTVFVFSGLAVMAWDRFKQPL